MDYLRRFARYKLSGRYTELEKGERWTILMSMDCIQQDTLCKIACSSYAVL